MPIIVNKIKILPIYYFIIIALAYDYIIEYYKNSINNKRCYPTCDHLLFA